jgi:hypothetical protein
VAAALLLASAGVAAAQGELRDPSELSSAFSAVAAAPGRGLSLPGEDGGSLLAIRELEAQIERDREALKRIISEPPESAVDPRKDARLLEIAARLPRLQAELKALLGESRR